MTDSSRRDIVFCKKMILSGTWLRYRCSKPVFNGGEYCWSHSPVGKAAIAKRSQERAAISKARDPWEMLRKAREEIIILREELEKLKVAK